MWFEDIPDALDPTKAMFFLGGKDVIIDTEVMLFLALLISSLNSGYCSAFKGIFVHMVYAKDCGSTPRVVTDRHLLLKGL